jgi:hypothetical protein
VDVGLTPVAGRVFEVNGTDVDGVEEVVGPDARTVMTRVAVVQVPGGSVRHAWTSAS